MDGFSFLEALRQHEDWRAIPIVVTAKDLTAEDHQRLNGYGQYIVHKGAYGREELLQELGDRIAACLGQVASSSSLSLSYARSPIRFWGVASIM